MEYVTMKNCNNTEQKQIISEALCKNMNEKN